MKGLFASSKKKKTKKCPLCGDTTLLKKDAVASSNVDTTLLSAQKIMLGGKRTPTEVCLECCKQLWPTSFLIRMAPRAEDAAFFKLAHSLAAIGMDYSTASLKAHVVKGQAHAHRILTSTTERPQRFNSYQEICEFTWFLLARSADKSCFLMSGSWQIEDPEYKLFNALSVAGYSRVLTSAKAMGMKSEKMTYGSSHLVSFLQHSRARGTWHVPEEHIEYFLSDDKVGTGYNQVGIDIPRSTTIKKTDEIGLFAGKRHVLCGKVPPKKFSQKEKYTFIKLEWHGTKKAGDAIGHIFDFVKTRKSKGKNKMNQHKEHADKDMVARFKNLMSMAFTTSPSKNSKFPSQCMLNTELTLDEIQNRAKIVGLSYMYELTQDLRAKCDDALRSGLYTESVDNIMRMATKLINDIESDPALDHTEVRFGREVIFGCTELLAAPHLPNQEELREQMVIYGLANVITVAVCDDDENADVINLEQLTSFFNRVSEKFGDSSGPNSTATHAQRTMEMIGDGNCAPAAQFKLFLLQRFAAYPSQFHDLAEVIAPGKVGPRPAKTMTGARKTLASKPRRRAPPIAAPPIAAPPIAAAPRVAAPRVAAPRVAAPRVAPRVAPRAAGGKKKLTTRDVGKTFSSATFEQQVKEIARGVSQRAQGFVTFFEVHEFCRMYDRWSSMVVGGKAAPAVDPRRARDYAKRILQQIGNGERATLENFQDWMSRTYIELFAKDRNRWSSLHQTLMKRMRVDQQEKKANQQSSSRRRIHSFYYYLDDQGNEQGPFDHHTMAHWIQEGHFNRMRMICGVSSAGSPSKSGAYVTVGKCSVLSQFLRA